VREEGRRRRRAIAFALAAAALSGVAGSAGAAGFSQPERVWVTTTGDHSERVSTLDVSTDPSGSKTVVMSLAPQSLRPLKLGDRLKASAELQATDDCLIESTRCVGNPYTYDPTIASQLVLASDATTTGGAGATPVSLLKQRTCVQQLPNRQHHCVIVFPHSQLDVSAGTLACPLAGCYLNLVANAYSAEAQPGDKVIVGEDEPDGSTVQDKGRVNAVRLRPTAPGPEPRAKVKTLATHDLVAGSLPVGDSSGLNRTVVLSLPLTHLRKRTQLAVNANVSTDVSKLPYNVLVQSKLILTSGRMNAVVSPQAKTLEALRGELAEGNGFNCTHADTPCFTQKVGVGRLIANAPAPLFANLVVATKALRATPKPSDRINVVSGKLKVVRYPPGRRG
jgi:hypothetical protein